MTRDEIITMARQAGFDPHDMSADFTCNLDNIEVFANLVAEAEREACIKIVMEGTGEPVQTKTLEIINQERERIAEVIRKQND